MINMKLLEFVTSLFIYHGFSTRRMLWEENFTGEEHFTFGELTAVNIKNCGRHNVSKHREIKGSDKYITLDISLKSDSIDNMRIKSSESKDNLGRSRKGFSTSLGLKAKVCQIDTKMQGITSEMSVRKTFQILSGSLTR